LCRRERQFSRAYPSPHLANPDQARDFEMQVFHGVTLVSLPPAPPAAKIQDANIRNPRGVNAVLESTNERVPNLSYLFL